MRYSYGSYVSEYTDLESLSNDFDSIIESFFNENSNFSLLIEADNDNKQSLWETIKTKFEKLIKFVKETIIPKVKQIFDTIKGKLITLGDSIDGILKSGKLVLGKDVNIVKADVMMNNLSKYDELITSFVNMSTNNFDKIDDLKKQANDIDNAMNDEKNHYIAKAGDKVNTIELTKIKHYLPKVQDAKNKLEGRLNGEVAEIDQLYRAASAKSEDSKKIYDIATFGISILRSSTSAVSKYILNGNAIVNSLQSKTKQENQQEKQAIANKK